MGKSSIFWLLSSSFSLPRGGNADIRISYKYICYVFRWYPLWWSELCGCHTTKELCQMADFGTICSKLCSCERSVLQDVCISGGQGSTQPPRLLLLLPSVCEIYQTCTRIKILINSLSLMSIGGRVQEIRLDKTTHVHQNHKTWLT